MKAINVKVTVQELKDDPGGGGFLVLGDVIEFEMPAAKIPHYNVKYIQTPIRDASGKVTGYQYGGIEELELKMVKP